MSRTTASRSLVLGLALVVVIGGLVGTSVLDLKISIVGLLLITVAFLEAVLIFAGFTLLQRRRLSNAEALESKNGEG